VTTPVLPRSGEGTIGPVTARILTAGFLVLIAVPGVWQVADPNAKSLLSGFSADARREGFQKALQLLESRVERDAAFPVAVR
jgi:hypothetical protein